MFFYTWQLLPTLIIETRSELLSKVYKYYQKISVLILPLAFIGLYIIISIFAGKAVQLVKENQFAEAKHVLGMLDKLLTTQGYLTTITNILSCCILIMTIRHAYKVTQKMNEFHEQIN